MTGMFDDLFEDTATPTTGGGMFDDLFDETPQQHLSNMQAATTGQALALAGTIGKTLQPFAAPQQVIFGVVGGLEDLATGQGSTAAWDTFKRGASSAGSYLTYQHGGDLPGILKNRQAPTSNPIFGRELFTKVGAPDWLAKWGGLTADFLLDVPVVGKATKLATFGKLDNARIIDNAATTFADPGAIQTFAAAILKAPFSTAPLRQATAAVPQGIRQNIGAGVGDLLEGARWRTGVTDADPAGFTVGELAVSRSGRIPGVPAVDVGRMRAGLSPRGTGLPDELVGLEHQAREVAWNIKFRLQDAGAQVEKVTARIPETYMPRWKEISTRLADTKSPGETAFWDGKLRQLGNDLGDPNLYADATKAIDRGLKADVYAATHLHRLDLMTPGELAAYQAGDKRHLRRYFGYYDNPVQHSERLERRGLPSSVQIDTAQLTSAFQQAITRNGRITGNPAQYATDLNHAWTNPDIHPADALTGFLKGKGWTDQEALDTVLDIAGEWNAKAGIKYKPDDLTFAREMRKRAAEGTGSQGATRGGLATAGNPNVLAQRVDLQDYQRVALEEVQDYAARAQEQAQKVGKLVEVRTITKGYEEFLQREGLIFDTIGPSSVQNTGGWRYVTSRDAEKLGTPALSEKYIPAMFHRRLMETTTVRDPSVLGAASQWTASKWQQFKLANPASIATNLSSGFVMAERAGVNPAALVRGLADYSRLVKGANRGDGVLDDTFRIGGVSMKEMMEHGDFLDATFTRVEVAGRLGNMERVLLNPNGSPLQRTAAGMSEFLQGNTQAAQVVRVTGDATTLGSRHIIAGLSNAYGQVDSIMKGGIYMASRRAGMNPQAAAKRADDILFNYENVPYAIDYARRGGLLGIPFASFQLLSTGRFMRTLYENPYAVEKYYRTANSAVAGEEEDAARMQAASPEYVRKALYLYTGRDKNGDARFFNLSSVLPETGVFDAFDADGVSRIVPPAVQLFSQWYSGKGYQGRDVYSGGGTFAETRRLNPEEAARGTLKALWQFGAVPWAPGQPMTERLAKSLAKEWVRAEDIDDPKIQGALKILSSGPAAPFEGPMTPQAAGQKDPTPPAEAALRFLGIKTVAVQDTLSKPGSGRQELDNLEYQLRDLDAMLDRQMKQAVSDGQQANVRAEFERRRAPLIEKLRRLRATYE